MKVTRQEKNRSILLFAFMTIWTLFIGVTLVKTQVFDYKKNTANVKKQRSRTHELLPKRGTIYDGKGEVLAISIKAKSAFLSNKDEKESLALLGQIQDKIRFHPNRNKNRRYLKDIKKRIKSGIGFIWIKRKLESKEYEKLKSIESSGDGGSRLEFLEEYKRIYPQGQMAAHILGGVGIDEQGLAGIEYELDSLIKGKGNKVEVLIDARQKQFKQKYLNRPVHGKDIYLTIDSAIQFYVEKELENTVRKHNARGGAVIAMDSQTGAILAIAGYPDYEPAELSDTSQRIQKNKTVSFLYHPGSTFKIVLASIALENEICSPQKIFFCYNGSYKVRNRVITDDHPAENLSFEEIIVHSSNIGAAQIGRLLGERRYYRGMKNFGFGEKTDLGLPGEEKGLLWPLEKWSGVSLPYLSHGYEILVTPIQMVRAFNVTATGYLVQPHVIQRIAGTHIERPAKVEVLSPTTTKTLSSIMTKVVHEGTGKKTYIEGIEIAGKTGTTKKMKPGKNDRPLYVSSFGGFFPAHNPRITMFVVIDEPSPSYYGGDVAAPLFKAIAEKLIVYLRIFPELDHTDKIRI